MTLLKQLEPTESLPGRKVETNRGCEGISEGFRLVEPEWVVLRVAEAVCRWLLDTRNFEETDGLEVRACSRA